MIRKDKYKHLYSHAFEKHNDINIVIKCLHRSTRQLNVVLKNCFVILRYHNFDTTLLPQTQNKQNLSC